MKAYTSFDESVIIRDPGNEALAQRIRKFAFTPGKYSGYEVSGYKVLTFDFGFVFFPDSQQMIPDSSASVNVVMNPETNITNPE